VQATDVTVAKIDFGTPFLQGAEQVSAQVRAAIDAKTIEHAPAAITDETEIDESEDW
jgi:hypothetical protein